jgi:hypothetical protein
MARISASEPPKALSLRHEQLPTDANLSPTTRGRWLASLCALAIIIGVALVTVPGDGRFASILQNSGHGPAFALLTYLILRFIPPRIGAKSTARAILSKAAIALGLAVTLGATTELVQKVLGRDAELADIIHDAYGATFTVALWISAQARSAVWSLASATVGAAAFLAWLMPLLVCGAAYWHRDQRFPALTYFGEPLDTYFIKRGEAEWHVVNFEQYRVLQVALDHGQWPGISLDEPVPDWSRYERLIIDLSNTSPGALTLELRINDLHHDGSYADRFNTAFEITTKERRVVEIDLHEVARAPAGRRMNMKEISELTLFHNGPAPGGSFLVHRILLR